jgi:hypothetical protein
MNTRLTIVFVVLWLGSALPIIHYGLDGGTDLTSTLVFVATAVGALAVVWLLHRMTAK